MALAISSLPVPVSPVIRMVARLGATCVTRSRMRSMRSFLPMMLGKLYCCLRARLSCVFSRSRRLCGDHAIDLDQQLLVVPGLGEIIVGAALERAHRDFHRAIGGDHEDRRFRIALANFAQHFHAGAVRHHQIQQNQVVVAGFDLAQSLGAILRQVDCVTFQCQQRFQAFANVRLRRR